jgi:hypothetical protein
VCGGTLQLRSLLVDLLLGCAFHFFHFSRLSVLKGLECIAELANHIAAEFFHSFGVETYTFDSLHLASIAETTCGVESCFN